MDYLKILAQHYPTVQVSCYGSEMDYDNLTWAEGDPLPSKAELDGFAIGVAQDEVWQLIKARRDSIKAGGVYVASVDKWFHSDDTSRIQQIALVMLGPNLPANLMWKTMDGTFILMTQALAGAVFGAEVAKDQLVFGIAEQHRQNMIAAEDPYSYDFSTGWPASFGE